MAVLRRCAVIVLAVALFGCGGADDNADTAGQEVSASEDTRSGPPSIEKVTHADAMTAVKQSDAQVTVVNFWATWCVPCVEEFPAFVKLDRQFDEQGVEVMFISTDFPGEKKKVVEFLTEHGVTGTSYLKKSGNTTEFVNNFSDEWSGAVPATFVYDGEATLLDFWEGKMSYEELRSRVSKHLENA